MAARGAYAAIADRLGGVPPAVASAGDSVVRGRDGNAIPVRVYRPLPAKADPNRAEGVIVYTHGGGWRLGDLDGFDRIGRALCAGSGHHVVSVDYRLAPEYAFPSAVHDALDAFDWATSGEGADEHGWDGTRAVVCGDSAGAQLAAVTALRRRAGVRAQMLAYPALDATLSGGSYTTFGDGPMLSREVMERCWEDYATATDRRHPDLSPLFATNLEGAPPAFVIAASHDVLRDDALSYAERLRVAGVEVTLRDVAGHPHGYLRWAGAVDEAGASLAAMGTYAAAAIAR